jgi:hypothetical protein
MNIQIPGTGESRRIQPAHLGLYGRRIAGLAELAGNTKVTDSPLTPIYNEFARISYRCILVNLYVEQTAGHL